MKRMFVAVLLLGACGAQQVKIAPLKIEPIHITVDVNLRDKDKAAEKKLEKIEKIENVQTK